MIMFLHGEDSFRSLKRLRVLRDAFQKKYDPQGHNIFAFEGEDFVFEEFRQALTVGGLFTQKRLVIVKRILTEAKQNFPETSLLDMLQRSVSSPDDIVIFWEEENFSQGRVSASLKQTTPQRSLSPQVSHSDTKKLLGFLLSGDHVEYYGPISFAQASRWLRDEVRKNDLQIDSSALTLLVQLVGLNLWQLNAEFQKLIHYALGSGSVRITRKDVEAFVRDSSQTTIFLFLDALSIRKSDRAVNLLHTLLAQGLTESYILSMLLRQVRVLLKIRSALTFSSQAGVLATQLGLHPFVVKKGLSQIKYFTFEELKAMYMQLVEMDRIRKTTNISLRTLLEMFVVRFASQRERSKSSLIPERVYT